MTLLAYSYSALDPMTGRLRTFTVNSDSRPVAFAAIRQSVQQINRERQKAGNVRTLAMPQAADLDATPTARVITGRVSCHA